MWWKEIISVLLRIPMQTEKNDAANNHNVHCISCTIMEISSDRILITGLE